MRIYRLLCLSVGWWRTISTGVFGIPVDGCDYVEEEVDIPALVTTTKCEICGRYLISWRREGE